MNHPLYALVRTLSGILLAALGGSAYAGSSIDSDEVGALLVYASIQASEAGGGEDDVETFLTITNASSDSTTVHMSFINGDMSDEKYCYECDFDVPLTGFDTETLVFTPRFPWTNIKNLDALHAKGSNQAARFGTRTCQWNEGMVIAWAEDGIGDPSTANRLFGDEVVVNYSQGYAYSLPAHSIQSEAGDVSRRSFALGSTFTALPRVVATNFLAPTMSNMPGAEVVLFTLDFQRQHPPETDCSVVAFDATENSFSQSLAFGCWTRIRLCDLDPELCFPNLGLDGPADCDPHHHGWLSFNCEVDHDAGDNDDTTHDGNVHGAIVQWAAARVDRGKNAVAWARQMFQSVSVGDPGALTLEYQSDDPLGSQ